MTTIGPNVSSLEDEIYGVIKAMMAKEKKRQQEEKKLRQEKRKLLQAKANKANEETPSPRGVADIDVSFKDEADHNATADAAAVVQQEERKAYIEHQAQTFLREVMSMTLTMMAHSRRLTILQRDVGYALEFYQKHGEVHEVEAPGCDDGEDEDDDEDWDSEMEDEEEEREDEEEIDDEDEEENEEAEDIVPTGFSSLPVPTGRFLVKEFKECLLWPIMHSFNCEVDMMKGAVELMSESMFYFLVQQLSQKV